MELLAGFGKADITPPVTGEGLDLRLLGFWWERAKPFTRINDPLHARAAVFDQGGSRVCAISLDLIGDRVGIAERVRERLQNTCHLPPERVMVACTHSHTTPEAIALCGHPVAVEWVEDVVEEVGSAVRQALDALAPCVLSLDEVAVAGVNVNRRAARRDSAGGGRVGRAGAVDRTLRVAWSRTPAGETTGVLANFACHPVGVQTRPFISADYPGVLAGSLEKDAPVALFFNGATGDLNPARMDGYGDVAWTGERLAAAARGAREQAELEELGASWHPGSVRGLRRLLRLPRRPVPPLAELRRQEEDLLARRADSPPPAGPRQDRLGAELFQLRERIAVAEMPGELVTEVQALEIRDWLIVAVPGELFCCLGDDIRRAARRHRVWVVGYANGYTGYIAPDEAFDVGGYELTVAQWSPLARGGGEQIRDAAIELIREIEDG